jgi:uncharacterized protein DUF4082
MGESLFTSQTPANALTSDFHQYTLGTVIVVAVAGTVTGGRWYFPTTLPSGSTVFVLYDADTQGQLARQTFVTPTAGAWNTVTLTSPPTVTAGQRLIACVLTQDRYVLTSGQFTSAGITNGNLTAPATGATTGGNGRFNDPNDGYPGSTFGGSCYFVDLVFEPNVDSTPPTVPTGLATTAIGSTTADLSWTASTDAVGVTGYELQIIGA